MKFRQHRGSLDESMQTVVDIDSKQEFCSHIEKLAREVVGGESFTISFNEYGYDDRIRWDTYLVLLNDQVLGMLDGPPPLDWFPPVEFEFFLETE